MHGFIEIEPLNGGPDDRDLIEATEVVGIMCDPGFIHDDTTVPAHRQVALRSGGCRLTRTSYEDIRRQLVLALAECREDGRLVLNRPLPKKITVERPDP